MLPKINFLLCWVWVAKRASVLGGRENSTEVSGEKGEKWSNMSSYLDGDKLAQDGFEHFLLQ